MKAQCQICGVDFDARPCHVASGRAKYCSTTCRFKSQEDRKTVPCDNCGKPLQRRPSQIFDAVYCGTGCRNEKVARDARPPIRIDGDTVLIPLTQEKWARVDRADFDAMPDLKRNWCTFWSKTSKTFYAIRGGDNRIIYMHRTIAGATKGQDVDHEDFDGLNNVRSNLRICTRSQNLQHRRKIDSNGRGACTSRYKGVSRSHGRWFVNLNGRIIGSFLAEEDAAKAYNVAAREAYGEFAELNQIDD